MFDYYYGTEAEQFSFYRIPKVLVKDSQYKTISMEAKFLYGLMLDRMSLSMKNGWLDKENKVYIIYTLEEIKEDMNCGNEKGVKTVAELEKIGLIERKRQGQGKPALVYVKNFIKNLSPENDEKTAEVLTSEKPKSENLPAKTQDFRKTEVKTSEKQNSRLPENRSQDFRKSECSNTDNNYININNIYNNQSINQSNNIDEKPIDTIDDTSTYIELVKENLEYDDYMEMLKKNTSTLELYKELYSIICDIVCVKRDTVRIGKQDYPYELVKARFLELNGSHLKYVIQCVKENCSEVKNIRAYLVTALYNSVSTIQSYYLQKRNATTAKKQPIAVAEAKKDKFLNYKQRTWDFEELRKLEREYNMRN